MTIGGGKKIPRTSLPASLATTPRSLEQWKQYIEMRKLVCIVGQQAGAARRALRRGTQPRVCLSSNRVPLSPSPTSLTPPSLAFSTLVFPFASLPFTLCACGLRTCARFSPFLPPLSFSLPYPLCVAHRSPLFFSPLSFLPFFFLREETGSPPRSPSAG